MDASTERMARAKINASVDVLCLMQAQWTHDRSNAVQWAAQERATAEYQAAIDAYLTAALASAPPQGEAVAWAGGTAWPSDPCVIWSAEHRQWWGRNGNGYVLDVRRAGIYSRADAEQRTAHCGPEKGVEIQSVASVLWQGGDGTLGAYLRTTHPAPPRETRSEAAILAAARERVEALQTYKLGADHPDVLIELKDALSALTPEAK